MEKALEIPHPYSPRDLHLPEYVPMLLPPSIIICVYIAAFFLVMAFVWVISGRLTWRYALDMLIMCWFAVSGLPHLILEGYYLYSPEFYKDASGFYLSEVWESLNPFHYRYSGRSYQMSIFLLTTEKEYSRSDSRYAAWDSTIVSNVLMVGPACLLAAYAIAIPHSSVCSIVGASLWYGLVLLDCLRGWRSLRC